MKIGKETEILEFKKTTGELKESVISMSAILNKHGGGEMYFGVHNDGTVLGQQIGEATLRDISQAVPNHLEPKVFPKIELVYLDFKPCIHVAFDGDEQPYFAYGRAYIRVADEDKQMSAAQLEEYILRKNARTVTWDSDISDKTAGDVDDSILREYLARANQAKRIDFTYTTKEDVLRRLGLVENGKLKNAANALYVGWPLLELQMAIFAGTERLTFLDIQRESGCVGMLIKIAERYITNNIRWRVEFDGSLQRNEIPEIPMDAVREAIINSFCHRDYRSSQNNEITIHSNRIEIYNPGTFPDGMTPNDFIEDASRSVKRNPLLAQLMYYVKDIESFGTGLKRITDECDAAGIKVEFRMMKLGFAVVFYRPEIHVNNGGNGDTTTDTTTVTAPDTPPDTPQVTPQVAPQVAPQDTPQVGNSHIERILAYCKQQRSRSEIQLLIGIKDRVHFAKHYLTPLLESGLLEMTIPDKPNSKNQKYIRSKQNG